MGFPLRKKIHCTRFVHDFIDSTCKQQVYSKYEHIHLETIKHSAVLCLEQSSFKVVSPCYYTNILWIILLSWRPVKVSDSSSLAISKVTTTLRCSSTLVDTDGSFNPQHSPKPHQTKKQQPSMRIFSHKEPWHRACAVLFHWIYWYWNLSERCLWNFGGKRCYIDFSNHRKSGHWVC